MPKSTRLVMLELYARGFAARRGIQLAESCLAVDLGCSVRTLIRHLAIGEYAGLIRRRRLGQGNVNIIELLLRPDTGKMADMSTGIKKGLPNVHPALLEDTPRTMGWWMKQIARHEEAMSLVRGKPKIVKETRGEYVA